MSVEAARTLARYVADHIGRRPTIRRWSSGDRHFEVNVAAVEHWPTDGDMTAFTVDLIATPLGLGPGEYELLMVANVRWADETQELVANAGLEYRRGTIPWAPGAANFDAVSSVVPGTLARNLVAVEPISPELRLETTLGTGEAVRWLQLLPLTDAELDRVGDVVAAWDTAALRDLLRSGIA